MLLIPGRQVAKCFPVFCRKKNFFLMDDNAAQKCHWLPGRDRGIQEGGGWRLLTQDLAKGFHPTVPERNSLDFSC